MGLNVPREHSQEFAAQVEANYKDNPYHNSLHAVQCSHTALWLSRAVGLSMSQTVLEQAAFLIAALTHDVRHFGRTNAFCINTRHELAFVYNDSRPMENMHAATCFTLMRETGPKGMLANLKRDAYLVMRSLIIEYILSADMSEHFETISKFRVRREASDFVVANEADRRFIARMCMKAGDIGHSALPWDLHTLWSMRVTQEFLEQGNEERELGLPVSPLCDMKSLEELGSSQKGFLEFVCTPLFEELMHLETTVVGITSAVPDDGIVHRTSAA